LIKEITALMVNESRLAAIEARIATLTSMPNITEQDLAEVDNLQNQKNALLDQYNDALNQSQGGKIIESVKYNTPPNAITIEEALNRHTGNKLDKDQHYIVACTTNPEKHIRCHSKEDRYNEKPYIRTTYDVYNGNEKLNENPFDDKRFNGRPKGYWQGVRSQMLSLAGIEQEGNAVYKFRSQADYETFLEHNKASREYCRTGEAYLERQSYDDRAALLIAELEELGYKKEETGVTSMLTGKEVLLPNSDEITSSEPLFEAAASADAIIMSRRAETYKSLASAERILAAAPENSNIRELRDSLLKKEKLLLHQSNLVETVRSETSTRSTRVSKSRTGYNNTIRQELPNPGMKHFKELESSIKSTSPLKTPPNLPIPSKTAPALPSGR
jgi:hypothetical protein